MNVFEAVKQSVTTRQAAEHFGIRVRRNGMCVCPFHADKNPSMKVDRRFHCFGCQADGDVIDFVSRLEAVSLSAPRKPPLCWRRCFPSPMRTRSRPATGSPGRKPRNSGSAAWSVTASGCCATIETCCAAGNGTMPQDARRGFPPTVCGSPAKAGLCGLSAGCAVLPGHGGTGSPYHRLWKGSEQS